MNSEIRAPQERTCLRCDRTEVWDTERESWVVRDDEVGDVFCIHAWDITGQFSPIQS